MPQTTGASEEEAAGQAVPHSVFDTTDVSPRKAFALWQEHLDHIADARLASDRHPFHARAEAVVLDRLVLGNVVNSTYVYDRSRFRIARDSVDHYMVQLYHKGRMICRKTGTGEMIEPGDMMLADMTNPEVTSIMDIDVTYLVMPRDMLAPLLVEPEARGMRYFSGDNALVRLLYEHLNVLFAQARHMTVEQARAVAPSVVDLAAAAINGAVSEPVERGVESTLDLSIRRHVRERAMDAELSPEHIAARFGISRRKLSYLFQEDGGIASFIQNERLHLARKALMDPAQRGRTIAEIAEAHGFLHRTSFARAFERIYCLTPGQQRALSATRRDAPSDPMSHTSPIKWIGGF